MTERKMLRDNHREICEAIADALPDDVEAYNQFVGVLQLGKDGQPLCRACVGAWLGYVHNAYQFGRHTFPYMKGAQRTAEVLGVSYTNLIALLRAAGAPFSPFGSEFWHVSAPYIFRVLAKCTEQQARDIVAGKLHTLAF